MDNQDRFST